MIRLCLPSGEQLNLKQLPGRKFRGLRIPGSSLFKSEKNGSIITLHWFDHPLYSISLRQMQFKEECRLVTIETNPWLRMEVPLSGPLSIIHKAGKSFQLTPGNYQLSDQREFASDHPPGIPIVYVSIHFSQELLEGIGSDQPFGPTSPVATPGDLLEMIYELMKCPFQESLRNFYYANKVREILFSHITSRPLIMPGELSQNQIAKMFEADQIMADNLDGRITIPELARRLGTNFVTLKRNYEKVFGIGIFPKLMQRKMNHIRLLLEKTDKPLKEIADLSGYHTLPGFINAFRKRYKMTPKEWRNKSRGKR